MPITPDLHGIMVLVVIAVSGAVWVVGRYAWKRGIADKMAHILGMAVVVIWIAYNIYYFLPSVFQWSVSLPLHICDVLAPVTFLALVRSSRKARAILYFCALPFAGQVILMPVGNQDPTMLRFWFYWIFHAGLLAASLFDFAIREFRPCLRDLVTAFVFDISYVLIILPVDVWFGWNYGYIGDAGLDAPTILEKLGPWPQRVFLLLALTFIIQTVMFFLPRLLKQFKR